MIRTPAAALLTIAITASACSGAGGPSGDDYARRLAPSIETGAVTGLAVDPDESLCAARAIVAEVGVDRVRDVGSPEEVAALTETDLRVFDLDGAAARSVADRLLSCITDPAQRFAAGLAVDDLAPCVADRITTDELRTLIASELRGDVEGDTGRAVVTAAVVACQNADPELSAYVEALAASILERASDRLELSADETACVARDTLEVIGAARATSFGSVAAFSDATEDDLAALALSEAELRRVAAGYLACSAGLPDRLRSLFLDDIGLMGDERRCVGALITDDVLIAIVAAALGGTDPQAPVAELADRIAACA